MNLTEIKNEHGKLSGILIPASDFSELKGDIKKGSNLYKVIEQLMSVPTSQQAVLSSGYSVSDTNDAAAAFTEEIYKHHFENGLPVLYQDDRIKNPNEFIAANPDGSEDLVKYDLESRKHIVLKRLVAHGQSKFAHLTINSISNDTTVLPDRGPKWSR